MAIKYIVNEKEQKIIAIIEDCKFDALNKIRKMLRANGDILQIDENWMFKLSNPKSKYFMNNSYKAVIDIHGDDVFNIEEGKKIAKNKVVENYLRALNNRIWLFEHEVLYSTYERFEDYLDDHWIE